MKEVLTKIKEYNTIIIHTHMRPDGDCYGAGFGLKYIIQESFPNKEVYVVGETSSFVSYIGEVDEIEDSVYEGALAIVVDTASKDRIGDQRYHLADFLIKIDHHILIDSYGDIEIVKTDRPAASQIILEFFNEFKDELKWNDKAKIALFTGIVTDTGRFKFRSVSGDTFRQVATLFDDGFDHGVVYNNLDQRSGNELKMKGYVLQHYNVTPNGVAYIKIPPEVISSFEVTREQATSFVNELGVLKDCPIWALFAEYEGGIVRARLRSKGPAINEIANKYDGGGHKLACGANIGTWDRIDDIINDLDELAKQYKSAKK